MASSDYPCSIRQAFMFEKDSQVLVGHLEKLQIGDITFAVDTELTVPTDFTKKKVVAPISNISWVGGYADPVYIDCHVSTANQKTASLLTHTNLSKTDTLFQFNIYVFDPTAKLYYLGFHSGGVDMKGLVMKSGGSLALSIDSEQDHEVESPKNYVLNIGIMPQEIAQALQLAISNTDKFSKQWGVGIGA
jgi:hypothetical protein